MKRTYILLASLVLLTGCASSSTWGWYVINPATPQGWINVKFLINGMGAAAFIKEIKQRIESAETHLIQVLANVG